MKGQEEEAKDGRSTNLEFIDQDEQIAQMFIDQDDIEKVSHQQAAQQQSSHD